MDLSSIRTPNDEQEMVISTKTDNEVAFIGELPEDILSLILSFLTVRDATASRVLSQRWRYLSAFTSDLQFDEFTVLGTKASHSSPDLWDKQRKLTFVSAVDHFLHRHYRGIHIRSLKLNYLLGSEFASYIDRWVHFAIELGIRSLKIDLSNYTYYVDLPDDYDWYLFSCHLLSKAHHLEHLSLHLCKLAGYIPPPCLELKTSHLNSLKTINLRRVNLLDDQSALNTVLFCCKKLEYLRLQRCELPSSFSIRGPARVEPESFLSLKLLVIKDCSGGREIEISSILLECLEYNTRSYILTFVGVSTLMERMHITVRYTFPNGFSKYLPRLQYLSLSMHSNEKYYCIPIPADLNKFNQLRELKIRFSYVNNFDLISLARMLNACPNLHKFRLEIYRPSTINVEDGEKVRWSYTQQVYHHLKEVEISGVCSNRSSDLELAIYLLRNAVRLEQMIIDLWRDPFSLPTNEELEMKRAAEELEMKMVHDVLINENPTVRVIVRDSSHSLFIPPTVEGKSDGSFYSPMFND